MIFPSHRKLAFPAAREWPVRLRRWWRLPLWWQSRWLPRWPCTWASDRLSGSDFCPPVAKNNKKRIKKGVSIYLRESHQFPFFLLQRSDYMSEINFSCIIVHALLKFLRKTVHLMNENIATFSPVPWNLLISYLHILMYTLWN